LWPRDDAPHRAEMAAVADDAGETDADLRLDIGNDGHQRVTVMRIASFGNATALGCAVVLTTTLAKSAGLAAPVRAPTCRLS